MVRGYDIRGALVLIVLGALGMGALMAALGLAIAFITWGWFPVDMAMVGEAARLGAVIGLVLGVAYAVDTRKRP